MNHYFASEVSSLAVEVVKSTMFDMMQINADDLYKNRDEINCDFFILKDKKVKEVVSIDDFAQSLNGRF